MISKHGAGLFFFVLCSRDEHGTQKKTEEARMAGMNHTSYCMSSFLSTTSARTIVNISIVGSVSK